MDNHEKYLEEQREREAEQQRIAAAATEQVRRDQQAKDARDAAQKAIEQQAKPLGW